MMRAVLTAVVLAVFATTAVAAPAGAPIRIGGTLALTGPLAPTALLHKIAGEVYIDELNKGNGLLGRPVEWVLLDDQSKPDLTRSLYEKLITVDKVDLIIGPYATSGILAAMSVAQRYNKVYIHHSFGMPHLAKYEMHFPTAAFGPQPNVTLPTTIFNALASTTNPPKTVAIVTSKFPSAQFQSSGAKEVAAADPIALGDIFRRGRHVLDHRHSIRHEGKQETLERNVFAFCLHVGMQHDVPGLTQQVDMHVG